jgi:hypothetical protein
MTITIEQIARRLKLESFAVMYKRVKSLEYGVACGVVPWVNLPYDCIVFRRKDGFAISKRQFLSEVSGFPEDQCFIWGAVYVVVQEDYAGLVEQSDLYEIYND